MNSDPINHPWVCPICHHVAENQDQLDFHIKETGHVLKTGDSASQDTATDSSDHGEEVPVATTTELPSDTSDIKEPWVDRTDDPEVEASTTELSDEEGFEGDLPNPDKVESEDTLQRAQDLGMYEDADDEHPQEVGVAEQINSDEELEKAS